MSICSLAGKEAEYGSHVEEIDEKRGSWWTHIISWSRGFGMYSTWMQTGWNYCWWMQNNVRITNFLLEQLKSYQVGKNLLQRRLRGPTTWKDMLENALRDTAGWQTTKSSSSAKFQVLAWMITHSRRKEQSQNGLRLATRLARLISYIHHISEFRQYCHVGNTDQHCRLGLSQDLDSVGDLEDSKSTLEWILRISGSRTLCPHQLDVQETNVSIPQFYIIWNHFVGCWLANGWTTCSTSGTC